MQQEGGSLRLPDVSHFGKRYFGKCRWYMICPVEIARDMSAFRAVRIRDHAKHGFLFEGRDGAGDESTGSDIAGHGEEDHVVASGGNYWHP